MYVHAHHPHLNDDKLSRVIMLQGAQESSVVN